jgi:hypothetical protein
LIFKEVNRCYKLPHRVKTFMDQRLCLAQWQLHTKLSTDCVGKSDDAVVRFLDEKLCDSKKSFANQGLTCLSIRLRTVLSTEGVGKGCQTVALRGAYPLPHF